MESYWYHTHKVMMYKSRVIDIGRLGRDYLAGGVGRAGVGAILHRGHGRCAQGSGEVRVGLWEGGRPLIEK